MEGEGDYRVVVKVKNARLLRAMERAGVRNQSELARLANASLHAVGQLANLTTEGMRKNGEWRKVVMDVSAALRCMPEDIVPDAHRYLALTKNVASFDTDIEEVAALLDGRSSDLERLTDLKITIGRSLAMLSPRERDLLERRFGLDGAGEESFEEIAETLGVSAPRVRQIVDRAISKLRNPRTASGRAIRQIANSEVVAGYDSKQREKHEAEARERTELWARMGWGVPQ
jgi:RNA polymerase sigma factor (sigma-70 family)